MVVASDGLWDAVGAEAVAEVVARHAAPKGACEALMAQAAAARSVDNTTVVVCYMYTCGAGGGCCPCR